MRDEYAVSPDGMRLFGLLELNSEYEGLRFAKHTKHFDLIESLPVGVDRIQRGFGRGAVRHLPGVHVSWLAASL